MSAEAAHATTDGESATTVAVTSQRGDVAESSRGDLDKSSLKDAAGGRSGTDGEDTLGGGTLTTIAPCVKDKPHSNAANASQPADMGGLAHSAPPACNNSSGVDEELKDRDAVDRPTSAEVLSDCPEVKPSVTAAGVVQVAAAKPSNAPAGDDDVSRSSAGDSLETSRPPPSTVGHAHTHTPAARHSLPSAVAAPRATGKHRLPPVLMHEKTTTTTSGGQGHGGLERLSPLSLVVGPHHSADSVRGSVSLTGGTRLGDLGLSQPPPPLNLSVADEAVNMKVVSTTTQRSTADSRTGMYSVMQLKLSGKRRQNGWADVRPHIKPTSDPTFEH